MRKKALAVQTTQLMQRQLKAKAAAQRGGKSTNSAGDPSRGLASLGYTVLGPIAAGAFSTILRCRATTEGQEEVVAVKSFDNIRCAKDVDVGAARDRELGVLRALRRAEAHPHIANMLAELGDPSSEAHVHAVLQYCEGGTLKRYLEQRPKGARDDAAREGMPAPIAAVGTRQLASALAHLHRLGICHRDVKPANILLARATDVTPSTLHLRLCDFGFACVCGDEQLTREFCTPQYAAPEIASPADAHRGYLGRPVDMWALGCVVYEMLHRRMAFKAEERFELEGLIRNCNFVPFDASKKRVPPDARALIRGLLAPVDRRLTAERVLRESPWVSEEAAAARAAERELEKDRVAAQQQEEKRRAEQGNRGFGL